MKRLLLIAATTLVPHAVHAHEPYVNVEDRLTAAQRHETGLDTLTPAQLARLNALLRGETEAAPQAATTPSPLTAAARPAPAANAAPRVGLVEGPIRSRLKGTVAGWEPGTVFELENGQRWIVAKGHARLDVPLVAPEVLVVAGMAGRWFLQVSEDLPKARVYLGD
jgi:hypothetical protein